MLDGSARTNKRVICRSYLTTRNEPISIDSVPLLNSLDSIPTPTLERLHLSVEQDLGTSSVEEEVEEEELDPTSSNRCSVLSVEEVQQVLDNPLL